MKTVYYGIRDAETKIPYGLYVSERSFYLGTNDLSSIWLTEDRDRVELVLSNGTSGDHHHFPKLSVSNCNDEIFSVTMEVAEEIKVTRINKVEWS